jgi:hypothetical protein
MLDAAAGDHMVDARFESTSPAERHMRTRRAFGLVVPMLLAASAPSYAQQDAPGQATPPPKILQITREHVRYGSEEAHAAHETAWAAAYQRANMPIFNLALAPMTGTGDVWYVAAWDSFAQMEHFSAEAAKNKDIAGVDSRMVAKDAEFVDRSSRSIYVYRDDMSHRSTTDWSAARYYKVHTVRERVGHDGAAKKISDLIAQGYDKAAVPQTWAMYESVGGEAQGTYVVVIPIRSLAAIDTSMMADEKFGQALGSDGMAEMSRIEADGIASEQVELFAVSPRMSIISDSWRASDVAFWGRKSTGAVMQAGTQKKP